MTTHGDTTLSAPRNRLDTTCRTLLTVLSIGSVETLMVEPSATLDLNLNSDVILDAFSTPCFGVSSNVTCCGCFQGVQSSPTLCWIWQIRRQKAAIVFRVFRQRHVACLRLESFSALARTGLWSRLPGLSLFAHCE